ncbi:MAG: LL-diaminopimelate aminotransferase, partial [Clostridia bacterium]|nr:LL-diaminopimelate aminotransferase [Clostridia bacterium]
MLRTNKNFERLSQNYLFREVSERVENFKRQSGQTDIISLGIGDVSLPLPKTIAEAFAKTANKMATEKGFKGYPPTAGYDFLRLAIADKYNKLGAFVQADEVFVSDGAKSDLTNLLDLFDEPTALVVSPSYPAYVDDNILHGNKVKFLTVTEEDGFLPRTKNVARASYVIYLCSPNNPTGVACSKKTLKEWVNFALSTGSVIIYDGAYEAFIRSDNPKSIFEISGARYCAIEVGSFSKRAGFTGVRCGWSVIPKDLMVGKRSLTELFLRRQSAKFNGVSYPVQVAAFAALTEEGVKASEKNVDYYLNNARLLSDFCDNCGLKRFGGKDAPYLFVKCP